jgi:hypothetical protein
MRAFTIAAAIAGLLLPALSGAEELDLGWFGTVDYDSNVFNTDEDGDATDDVVLRTGPVLGLRRSQGDLTYDVRYEPRYETFVDNSELDEFDHSAFGRLRWQLDAATAITAVNRFSITHSANRATFITDPAAPDVPPSLDVEVERQELILNSASLEVAHSFTPRLRGTMTGSQSIFRTDHEDRFDSDTYNARGELLYMLNPRDQVGGGIAVNFNDFSDIENPDGSTEQGQDVTSVNPFLRWVHTFDPTFTLSVQAGPTWIDVDQPDPPDQADVVPYPLRQVGPGVSFINASTCPTDDGVPILSNDCMPHGEIFGGVNTLDIVNRLNASPVTVFLDDDRDERGEDITIFAAVSLQKRWERFRTALSYQRQDSNSSGVGQSTILDVLSLFMAWEPVKLWSVHLLLQASLRDQTNEQQGTVLGIEPTAVEVRNVFIPGRTDCPCTIFPVPASRSVSLRLVDNDSFQEALTYRANLKIKRRIGRRSEVFGVLDYFWQDVENSLDNRQFDSFRATIGARWMYDPIHVF